MLFGGIREPVPRHNEIDNNLVKRICRRLSVPPIGG